MAFFEKTSAIRPALKTLGVVLATLLFVSSFAIAGKPHGKIDIPGASAQLTALENGNNIEKGNVSNGQNESSSIVFRGLI